MKYLKTYNLIYNENNNENDDRCFYSFEVNKDNIEHIYNTLKKKWKFHNNNLIDHLEQGLNLLCICFKKHPDYKYIPGIIYGPDVFDPSQDIKVKLKDVMNGEYDYIIESSKMGLI